jgi:hypothetical protein
MISIGGYYHGPELKNSETDRVITSLMKAATFELGKDPEINVIFYVPGSLGGPDWEGIRDAKFSRKQQLLMIQVAVPAKMVNSPQLKAFLIENLHQANALAAEVFRKKGLEYPFSVAEKLVDQITQRLS